MPFASNETSKIKMVILTGPGEKNITWHSPVKQNRKPHNVIIEGMLRRFKDNYNAGKILVNKVQVIQFYENGEKIEEFRPDKL